VFNDLGDDAMNPKDLPQQTVETEFAMRFIGGISDPHRIGSRLVFNVASVEVKGPELSGKGIAPSGDWITIRDDGSWKLDVRFSLEMDDGSYALVEYNGIVKMTPEQFAAGQEVGGINVDEVYFYSTPYITTNSEKYAWLNDHVFVAKIVHFGGGVVIYDVFKLV
jgi:Protein of unknown function (DUF3237)